MVRQRDYQLGLYNEFEKLNKKLDSLLKENKVIITEKSIEFLHK